MSETTSKMRKIAAALRNKDRLTDGQVSDIAALRRGMNAGTHHVAIGKFELRQGESLSDFASVMWSAVMTDRIILADGSLDAWLVGIYSDHVIVEDGNTGRLFRSFFTRNSKGEVSFETPTEVRQVYVPLASDDSVAANLAKSAPEQVSEIVRIERSDRGTWGNLIPDSIRRGVTRG